jgi:peptide/nickel transport system substrate-binding protein
MDLDIGGGELGITAVRQAISLAIDRQAIIDALAFGLGTATATHMPPFYWASSPNVPEPVQDLDAARKLLADAGVGEFSVPILAGAAQGLTADVTQAVKAQLAEVGITIDVEVAGENLASRLFFDRDGGGVVGPWSGRPDPAQTIANVDGPGFVNMAKNSVPEIDALLVESNAETDPVARQKLLWQIDELAAVNHVSGVALFSPKTVFAFKNNVSGLPIYVQGKHEFRDACVAPE